jgi:hypothetical protein
LRSFIAVVVVVIVDYDYDEDAYLDRERGLQKGREGVAG